MSIEFPRVTLFYHKLLESIPGPSPTETPQRPWAFIDDADHCVLGDLLRKLLDTAAQRAIIWEDGRREKGGEERVLEGGNIQGRSQGGQASYGCPT